MTTLQIRQPKPLRTFVEKVFGMGDCVPMAKPQKDMLHRSTAAMTHPTRPGHAWGDISAKTLIVYRVLLWNFHNCHTGRCFPSYESIAEMGHVSRATVARAIVALRAAGLITWVNRLRRIKERIIGVDGEVTDRLRVVRSSNAYVITPPKDDQPVLPQVRAERPARPAISPRVRSAAESASSPSEIRAVAESVATTVHTVPTHLTLMLEGALARMAEARLRAAARGRA